MPRRTYAPKAGRRRPTAPNPDALLFLAYELQRRAQWRPSESRPDYHPHDERDRA